MHHRHQSSNIFMWGLAKVSGGKAASPPAPFLADFLAAPVAPPQEDRFFGAMTWPRRSCPGIQGCVKKRYPLNIKQLCGKKLVQHKHVKGKSVVTKSPFHLDYLFIVWRIPISNLDFVTNPHCKSRFCAESQILIL